MHIVFPAKLVIDGRVVEDKFPGWSKNARKTYSEVTAGTCTENRPAWEDEDGDGAQKNSRELKVLTWNINGGLQSKLEDGRFLEFLCLHDVILTECWIDNVFHYELPNYVSKYTPRVKSKT